MALLLTSTIKVSVILVLALGATPLLRKRSAAIRHLVLSAVRSARWRCRLSEWIGCRRGHLGRARLSQALRGATITPRSPPRSPHPRTSRFRLPRGPGFGGAESSMACCLKPSGWPASRSASSCCWSGWAGWRGSRSRAHRVAEGPWTELVRESRPVLASAAGGAAAKRASRRWLVTWGLVRPRVILPVSARDWPRTAPGVVLYHEPCAHPPRRLGDSDGGGDAPFHVLVQPARVDRVQMSPPGQRAGM